MKWEYITLRIGTWQGVQEVLNDFGAGGWRLAEAALDKASDGNGVVNLIMERAEEEKPGV